MWNTDTKWTRACRWRNGAKRLAGQVFNLLNSFCQSAMKWERIKRDVSVFSSTHHWLWTMLCFSLNSLRFLWGRRIGTPPKHKWWAIFGLKDCHLALCSKVPLALELAEVGQRRRTSSYSLVFAQPEPFGSFFSGLGKSQRDPVFRRVRGKQRWASGLPMAADSLTCSGEQVFLLC